MEKANLFMKETNLSLSNRVLPIFLSPSSFSSSSLVSGVVGREE